MKYKGLICIPMWQEVEVEAENANEAFDKMCDVCDINKAYMGEPYVYDCQEADKYLWDKKEEANESNS